MKKIGFVLGIIFFSWVGLASAAGPQVYLDTDTIDLGKLEEGKVYDRSFWVQNQGDVDLVIKTAVSSCSCLELEQRDSIIIAAGQKKEFKFSFDSTGYAGQIIQSIFLHTNDPNNKTVKINIRADVLREAQAQFERFSSFTPGIIITAGLIDGINPCAFTVLVFFISFLTFVGYKKAQMLACGISFILAVFLTYLLIGFGLFKFLQQLEIFRALSKAIYIATGILAIVLGLFSWYDWRIYSRTKDPDKIKLKLPGLVKRQIQKVIRDQTDIRQDKRKARRSIFAQVSAALSCGFVVSILESVCTGQMYLPTIVYVLKTQKTNLVALVYLLVYNLMFILPLIVIFVLGVTGVTSRSFSAFLHRRLGLVKLLTAFVFFCLGVALLLVTLLT